MPFRVRSLALLFLVATAAAQKQDEIVRWIATGPTGTVRRGETVQVGLTARIEAGWQLYAMMQPPAGPPPMRLAVAKGPFAILATRFDAPVPAIKENSRGEPENYYYEDQVTLAVPVIVSNLVKSGEHRLSIDVTYQVCSGSRCLRPFTQSVPVRITVKP